MQIPLTIRNRFTIGVGLALLHYLAWRVAVFGIHHSNEVEGPAADFFFTVFTIRWYVVAGVCAYSVLRRFVFRPHQWDLYGPPLSLLSACLMYLEIQKYV
jgi:hypothetical protein